MKGIDEIKYTFNYTCNFSVEQQDLLHISQKPQLRGFANESPKEKRGSVEETRRILQEIERINQAMGYTRRNQFAFPRVASGEGYFYPRQNFRPEFLTKPKLRNHSKQQRAINPFNTQNYYYPTPYLQVPIYERPLKFKKNNHFKVLPLSSPQMDDSVRLGTIIVMPEFDRSPKAIDELKKNENSKKSPKDKQEESSIIEEFVNYELQALGLADIDDDEDERKESISTTPRLPAIKNDKFLNLALKKHPHETDTDDDDDDDTQFRSRLPPSLPPANRAFNFSNSIEKIQNITKQFAFHRDEKVEKKSEDITTSTTSPEDIEEETEEKADDKEDEKSPFGFVFGPKQQLQTFKEGGLIIQRLRVRQGGIAIAGEQ